MPDRIRLTRRAMLASTIFSVSAISARGAWGASQEIYKDPRAPIEARVKDLLGRMTLEEKVAQMSSLWFSKAALLDKDGNFSPDKADPRLANGIGQIARPSDTMGTARYAKEASRGIEDTVALINAIQTHLVTKTRLGIPALFHEETAHGLMAPNATSFPIPPGLGSTWDPALVERAFAVVGREARIRGATVALSPVIDLSRDPRYGRVEEFFGEDPYLVSRMGAASVRGQQGHSRPLGQDKVFVTLKHFVHASPEGGLNLAPAAIDERTLRAVYLPPFEYVIKKTNPAIIMPSYNELAGVPSHANAELLIKTGRERLGFKGPYFSDYGGVTNLVSHHHMAADNAGAAILALNAGVDAELPDTQAFSKLPALVREGRVKEAAIDDAVSRILELKFEAGLFEAPYLDPKRAIAETNTPADVQLARTVAQKALILLKNDGVLPLDPKAKQRIAVIGPNSREPLLGGYSSTNTRSVGLFAGLTAAAGKSVTLEQADGVWITQADGEGRHRSSTPIRLVPPEENARRIAEAVEVASRADVIVLAVGDRPEITREAVRREAPGDRSTLGLFGDQDRLVEALIATGKPIVTVLINGRPLAIPRLVEKSAAVIEAWYAGQEGGNAIADAVFGKVNPGGKLTVSFPRSVGELPVYYDRHPSSDENVYVEGKRRPLFPFGYGLSYTKFEISAPRLAKSQIGLNETAIVEVDVTNVGSREGDEVVQLYIRDQISSVPRPVLELRGFERVTLKAGASRTLRFELTPDDLAFWDIAMNWVVEPGAFTISVGPNSADLRDTVLNVV